MRRAFHWILLFLAILLAVLAVPIRLFAVGAQFSAVLLLGAAGILALLWGLNLLCVRFSNGRAWRRVRRVYLICLALGVALFLVLEGLVVYHARTDWETKPDCVVVLGAGIYGTEPSPILKTRLDAAIAYLERWPGVPVILSGGQGQDEVLPEAEVMYRYFLRRGVPAEQITREEKSDNTKENILYSMQVMETLGLDPGTAKIALVTSDFHLARGKLLAVSQGMEPIGVSAGTPWFYLRINYFAREAFALARQFI